MSAHAEEIRKCIQAIDSVAPLGAKDGEFIAWQRDTRVCVENAFGLDSRQVVEFTAITFTVRVFPTTEPLKREAYRHGLDRAKAVLGSMARELETMSMNEVPRSGMPFDAPKLVHPLPSEVALPKDVEARLSKLEHRWTGVVAIGTILGILFGGISVVLWDAVGKVRTEGASAIDSIAKSRFDAVRDVNAAASESSDLDIPVGTVVAYTGILRAESGATLLPAGWLLCDGREVEVVKYENLARRLGQRYGRPTRDGLVRLPNLGGRFLRGVTTSIEEDPDLLKRAYDNAPFADNPPSVGSVQESEFKAHRHSTDNVGDLPLAGGQEHLDHYSVLASWGGALDRKRLVNGVAGGAETRPRNMAVYWIIKAR